MKTLTRIVVLALVLAAVAVISAPRIGAAPASGKWVSLFDGKSLDGWKASEAPGTFHVEDGAIVVNGNRSHLYYVGTVNNHDFKNFEWKADVMTFPHANSGMYFHTEWQETGWPAKGYEVQVNNSHTDTIRTGSLYQIINVLEHFVPDNQWYTESITVQGKHVVVRLNGTVVVDYTEPENVQRPEEMKGRVISHGTFALQGHDPGSKVLYKNVMVKVLR